MSHEEDFIPTATLSHECPLFPSFFVHFPIYLYYSFRTNDILCGGFSDRT
jgi:hypothetical protein